MKNKPLIKWYICPQMKVRNISDVRVERMKSSQFKLIGKECQFETATTSKQLCCYLQESICPALFRQFKQLYCFHITPFLLGIPQLSELAEIFTAIWQVRRVNTVKCDLPSSHYQRMVVWCYFPSFVDLFNDKAHFESNISM